MTNVCMRCRTRLTGPVCTACGLPAPVGAYGPPMQPMQPGPYGMPYGGYMPPGYAMMPVPTTPPKKTMAVVGGVSSLVASALTIGMCLWAVGNHDFTDRPNHSSVAYMTMVLAAATAVFGIFAIKGQWWASMTAGIIQSLQVIMTLAMAGLCIEARDHLMLRYDYDNIFGGGGLPYDDPRLEALKSMSGGFFFACVAVLIAAIFAYIGIGGARAWARYQKHISATQAF